MKVVEMLCGLVGDAASVAFPPSTAIFGAVALLAQAANKVSSAYDGIIDLFEEINAFVRRLSVHEKHQLHEELSFIIIEILAHILNVLAIATKTIRRAIFLKSMISDNDELCSAVQSLHALTEKEIRMVATLSLSRTTQILIGVADIAAKLDSGFSKENQRNTQNLEAEKQIKLETVKRVLNPETSVTADYETCYERVLKGTGDWIYDDSEFKLWKRPQAKAKHSMIWISGSPGVGKSHLSSQIIKHLSVISMTDADRRNVVAYFFCRENDPTRRGLKTILRSLAWQCANLSDHYLESILPLCKSAGEIEHLSITTLWRRLFVDRLRDIPITIFLVIDGSDEAYREELGTWFEAVSESLETLQNSQTGTLKIAVVGRPDIGEKLEQAFYRDQMPLNIKVNAQRNNADICRYITEKINKSRLKKMDKKIKQEIIQQLTQSADGMFLYVNLMLDEITKKTRPEQIRQILKSLPRGLSATFERTLQRYEEELEEDDIIVINRLLCWVLCSEEPKTVDQLQEWLKLRHYNNGECDGDPNSDFIDLASDIQNRYSSLFSTFEKIYKPPTLVLPMDSSVDPSEEGLSEEDGFSKLDSIEDGQESTSNSGCADTSDSDGDEEFDAEKQVYVRFCHASLGDFLNSRVVTDSKLNITKDLAYYWIVIDCLNKLCQTAGFEDIDDWDDRAYAASWYQYINRIDPATLPSNTKITLLKFLEKLYTQDMEAFLGTDARFFQFDIGFYDALKVWICEPDTRACAPPELLEWMDKLKLNMYDELLLPVIKKAAEMWIPGFRINNKFSWDAIEIICCYLNKTYLLRPDEFETKFTVDDIYQAARFIQPIEDAWWHCAVGKILMYQSYPEEGRQEFLKAIILDNNYGTAIQLLEVLYSEFASPDWSPKKYEEPLTNLGADAVALENANELTKGLYFGSLASPGSELDLLAEIKQLRYLALRAMKDKYVFDGFVETLRSDEFLEWIQKWSSEPPGTFLDIQSGEEVLPSCLTQILQRNALRLFIEDISRDLMRFETFIAEAIHVCRAFGRTDFVEKHVFGYLTRPESSLQNSPKEVCSLSDRQIDHGKFTYDGPEILSDPDNIVRVGILLKQIYDLENREDGMATEDEISRMKALVVNITKVTGDYPFSIKETAILLLANMCFRRFMSEIDKKSRLAMDFISVLQGILKSNQGFLKASEMRDRIRWRVSVWLCYMLHSNSLQEATALGRSLIKHAISIIRNYDPFQRYGIQLDLLRLKAWLELISSYLGGVLYKALASVGDKENAYIAFHLQQSAFPILHLQGKSLELRVTSEVENDAVFVGSSKELHSLYMGIMCMGVCDTRFKVSLSKQDEFFECLYCYDFAGASPHNATFCKECYAKLQSGELKHTLCDKSHPFFHWKGATEAACEKAKEGILVVEGQDIVLREWLSKLENAYDLI
ncbi:hypothetical protein ABW20_dc0109078 [Dactylellina cionopaga]|nr:hypothetical protein ABW20_dc0109078 [Dactylellina cionopaga]